MVEVAYVPTMCNHCDNAPCVTAGKGAVRKRDDGIVIIDPVEAIGKKDLVDACPYGAIWWNEERKLPQAWAFDAHLIDRGWQAPRCVQSCPTGAIRALKVSDHEMAAIIEQEQLRIMAPEHQTRPRVHYKNLHRYDRLFVGGAIVGRVFGTLECVAEARIELLKNGKVLSATESDVFGEFKIDALEEDSGSYELQITHKHFNRKSLPIQLGKESVVLDVIDIT